MRINRKKIDNRLIIGILMDFVQDDLQSKIRNGISEACKKNNIISLYITVDFINNNEKNQFPGNYIYNTENYEDLDGLIILTDKNNNPENENKIKNLIKNLKNIPIVSLGTVIDNVPSVEIDKSCGIIEIIEHLIIEHKLNRIAFIKGLNENPWDEISFKIYKDVLLKHGIPFIPEIVINSDISNNSDSGVIDFLFNQNEIKYDGLISADGNILVNVLCELLRRNIFLPCAAFGFGKLDENKNRIPLLTTISLPEFDAGFKAVKIIIDLLNKKEVNKITTLQSRMVIGRSCGCFKFGKQYSVNYLKNIKNIKKHNIEKDKILDLDLKIDILESLYMIFPVIKEVEELFLIINNLVDILDTGFVNQTINEFLLYLDYMVNKIDRSLINYFDCSRIITIMINKIIFSLDNNEKINFITDLWNRALMFILCLNQKNISSKHVNLIIGIKDFFYFNLELVSAYDFISIKKLVIDKFPEFGIGKFYINEFLEDNKLFKTSMSYDKYNNFDITGNIYSKYFDFFKNIILNNTGDCSSFLMMLLFYESECLGFILFEDPGLPGIIYKTIAGQLIRVLKVIRLLERNKNAEIEIEDLHIKINSFLDHQDFQSRINLNKLQKQVSEVINDIRFDKVDNNKNINYNSIYDKYNLTKRERELIELMKTGFSNKDISENLMISIRTVEFHFHNIYKKLNVQNKIELLNILNKS